MSMTSSSSSSLDPALIAHTNILRALNDHIPIETSKHWQSMCDVKIHYSGTCTSPGRRKSVNILRANTPLNPFRSHNATERARVGNPCIELLQFACLLCTLFRSNVKDHLLVSFSISNSSSFWL